MGADISALPLETSDNMAFNMHDNGNAQLDLEDTLMEDVSISNDAVSGVKDDDALKNEIPVADQSPEDTASSPSNGLYQSTFNTSNTTLSFENQPFEKGLESGQQGISADFNEPHASSENAHIPASTNESGEPAGMDWTGTTAQVESNEGSSEPHNAQSSNAITDSNAESSAESNAGSHVLAGETFMRKKDSTDKRKRQTAAEKERQLARDQAAKKKIFEGVDEISQKVALKDEDNGPLQPGIFDRAQSTVYEGTPALATPEPSNLARRDEEFEAANNRYEERKRNGQATVAEGIKNIRLKKKEAERKRMVEAIRNGEAEEDRNEAAEAGDSLFLSDEDEDEDEDEDDGNYSDNEVEAEDLPVDELSNGPEQSNGKKKGPAKRGQSTARVPRQTPFSGQKISTKDLNASRRAGIPEKKKRGGKSKNEQSTAKGNPSVRKATKTPKQPKSNVSKKRKTDTANEDDEEEPPPAKKTTGGKRQRKGPEGQIKNLGSLFQTAHSRVAGHEDIRMANHQFSSNNKRKELTGLIAAITDDQDRDMAKADSAALMSASASLDQPRSVRFKDGHYQITGMKTPLRHFQLLGLARMREFERREQPTSGGILGDQMGLGKTISMLSNILDGRPKSDDALKGTLIIVPTAVLHQWMSEIRKHLHPDYLSDSVIFDRTYIDNHREPARTLLQHDIVLTSYHYLKESYPVYKPPADYDEEQKADWWAKEFDTKRGPLHRVKWLRVVLDECQVIKNYKSITSIAANGLIAKHRWLMSGTILVNGLEEMFSYSRFLRSLPTENSFSHFEKFYMKNENGKARLHQYLSALMIRREYDDRICGSKIVLLPEMKQELIKKRLNCFEAHFYEVVRARCKTIFRGLLKEKVENNPEVDTRTIWRGVLLIVILRQLTDHFLSCTELLGKYLEKPDVDSLQRILKNHLPNPSPGVFEFVNKQLLSIGKMIRQREAQKLLMSAPIDDSSETSEDCCMVCHHRSEDLWVAECKHILCGDCWDKIDYETLNHAQRDSYCPAEDCDQPLALLEAKSFRDADWDNGGESETEKKGKKGKDSKKRKELPINVVMLSTKMKEVERVIQAWLEEDSRTKIVVFTQLLDVATMVHQICEVNGWTNLTYTGKMSAKLRSKAVEKFQDGKADVLIASMLAGGVGLNLTKAARALLIDLYWNEAMEQQAFSRIYRIGQEKPTSFSRLSLAKTCDDYLLRKQKIKAEDIREVLKGKGQSLTVEELLELFDISPMSPDDDIEGGQDSSKESADTGSHNVEDTVGLGRQATVESVDENE